MNLGAFVAIEDPPKIYLSEKQCIYPREIERVVKKPGFIFLPFQLFPHSHNSLPVILVVVTAVKLWKAIY